MGTHHLVMPGGPFREQALRAAESRPDIERLLPVTSWRTWLLGLAAVLLVSAAVLYAAADSRLVTVSGEGRVADDFGIRLVTSSATGQVLDIRADSGDRVEIGQVVATVEVAGEPVEQRSAVNGTVVWALVRPGDPVEAGAWMFEVASDDSDGKQALIALSVDAGSRVTDGMTASVTVAGGLGGQPRVVPEEVAFVSEPLPGLEVQYGLALYDPPTESQVVAFLELDEVIEPGSAVSATIIVSERNLLQQMLGIS
ncbi:MAG TPA: biotin/lipoyl-containing protein [Acidimicrobiia bacterium]